MVALLKKYKLNYEVLDWTTSPPVKEQARILSRTGLLITMHGAGLTNMIFMHKRTAVMEIFPHKIYCPIYGKMANMLGLNYFPLFAAKRGQTVLFDYMDGPQITDERRIEKGKICEELSSLEVAHGGHTCWGEYIHGSVVTPIAQFELLLLRALDHLGMRVYPVNSTLAALEGVYQGGPEPYIPQQKAD